MTLAQRFSRTSLALLLSAVALGTFPGCTQGGRGRARPDGPAGGTPGTPPAPSGSMVTLTDDDLAPVDGYIRRRRWILGDELDVTASKEYFAQNLTIVSRVGTVHQDDAVETDGASVTLTFLGPAGSADVLTAPRVMIGTGITVTARHQIRVHFVKTTDTGVPVRLSITAHGRASTGVGETVERRAEDMTIGGILHRDGTAYRFDEISR